MIFNKLTPRKHLGASKLRYFFVTNDFGNSSLRGREKDTMYKNQ